MSIPRVCWRVNPASTLRICASRNQPRFCGIHSRFTRSFPRQQRCIATAAESISFDDITEPQGVTPSTQPENPSYTVPETRTTPHYQEVSGGRGFQVKSLLADDTPLFTYGIRDLFSNTGFEIAYKNYQESILTKLNAEIENKVVQTAYDPDGLTKIIFAYANKDPVLFNYASMAYNNHFFFSGLRLDQSDLGKVAAPPKNLLDAIERDFHSLANLKSEMLAAANAMFGPGFVWLVWDQGETQNPHTSSQNQSQKKLHIMTTYGAGSPLRGAHFRAQVNNRDPKISFEGERATIIAQRIAQGTMEVGPVLCVSTWQHTYLFDWAFEKERYLEQWWKSIDWLRANELLGNASKPNDAYFQSAGLHNSRQVERPEQ